MKKNQDVLERIDSALSLVINEPYPSKTYAIACYYALQKYEHTNKTINFGHIIHESVYACKGKMYTEYYSRDGNYELTKEGQQLWQQICKQYKEEPNA